MFSARKIAVGGLVVVGLVLVAFKGFKGNNKINPRHIKADDTRPKFTFDDIYSSKFSYKSVSPRWVSGHEYIIKSGDVILRNVATDTETVLMPSEVYSDNSARGYWVSADRRFIALLTNYKKGWRHSYNGTYLIYDVDKGAVDSTLQLPDDVQYFKWSPVGNALAYVTGFNIFYKSDVTAAPVQVTIDGWANHIYNGIPDWVYEEEMISSNNVMYFSPDGTYLAYAQFNDSRCKHIQFSRYDGKNYPEMIDVSYPKAGTTQPTNRVFVYDTAGDTTKEVSPPGEMAKSDYLFSRVTWANDTRAAVTWCNREQNWSIMRLCDVDGIDFAYTDSEHFEHRSSTGWVYQRRPYWIPVFGQSADEFFTVRPNGKWQHLYRVTSDGAEALTEGDFTVTSESASYPAVEFYDKDTDTVFFSATKNSPQVRHIYVSKGRNPTKPNEPNCITCKLSSSYTGCDTVTISFSTNGSYAIARCGGDGPPMYMQYMVNPGSDNFEFILHDDKWLEQNEGLQEQIDATQMSEKQYHTFASKTGYDFTYQIWYPPQFDDSKKYPLLIDVYAGPGYQRVYAAWTRGWQTRFVPSSLDVIVASVDGRGSNFYGDEFMHEVYRKLGQYEPLDQLEFAKYLGGQSYIDESRIAVWGWSYGGYATSHILGNDNDRVIKCGLAVAPLTDWRFYDTIYAERYMGLPSEEDNKEGYEKASVLPLAKNFRQSSYFLIHGTADDNVHFQNAARLEYQLVQDDIDFNDFFYADQDHSINVGNANQHVYKVLTRQLCQCFDIPVPSEVWN